MTKHKLLQLLGVGGSRNLNTIQLAIVVSEKYFQLFDINRHRYCLGFAGVSPDVLFDCRLDGNKLNLAVKSEPFLLTTRTVDQRPTVRQFFYLGTSVLIVYDNDRRETQRPVIVPRSSSLNLPLLAVFPRLVSIYCDPEI